jgi:hypothetical protein
MRRVVMAVVACLVAPTPAWAQASIAGAVKDASGGVLPGVAVEAASPELIERVRTAVSDSNGRYRIEDLRPGTYTVTFTLVGFMTLKRDGVILSGSAVTTIDAELRVGGVAETVTVTGESPVVDVVSTKREVTLDNQTMRNLPSVRSYSYLLTAVPGVQSNITDVNTGPVFAIFPVHGGRGVESRLTVDGLNISNPPGGNQPPNFTADIGNAAEVSVNTSGGLGEAETAGVQMNIVPKQGGNKLSGLVAASGFSKGMQSNNFTPELQARGASSFNPTYHVYDFNAAVGGPILKDKLWYYISVREQGSRRNTLNVFYNKSAGDPTKWNYDPDFSRPAYYDRLWENYTPRITWQASPRNKITFSWDEQPVCRTCTGTASFAGSPSSTTAPEADGHGEYFPQRVHTVRWTSTVTSRLLLEAGLGNTYYQWGDRELTPNPTRDLIRVTDVATTIAPGLSGLMTYRSQSWLVNKTDGANWTFTASYVTGSHSMKFGYQGNWWRDDRELHTNTQNLAYTWAGGRAVFPGAGSITEYANPYFVNARAASMAFYVQDQWTVNRLTLQGALRYDRPWSWFPEVTQPANNFFPGVSFPRQDGVTGYNDITPRIGAAYDLFGTGKTSVKVNIGKYLQGASVSNLAYTANPSLRIPGANASGFVNPNVTRTWNDPTGNHVPNCNLQNPLANGDCGQISALTFGTRNFVGANFDPDLLSGWNLRPSDWSFGASVQHELFPRASVEVGYFRRSFTMYTTGGTINDNLAINPSDVSTFYLTVPSDPRLPGGGGYRVGPLYNVNPNVFGQSNGLIESATKVGDDTRTFNGVDVTFNVRAAHGVTFSGGTGTGKVVNDWCAVRAAVPENFLLNPYCRVESPVLTSFNGLAAYTIPKVDVLISGVYHDRPLLNGTPNNASTDQLGGSLQANYTMTAADLAAAAAQLGRPLTGATFSVNLVTPGTLYGARNRELDLTFKKIVRLGAQRLTAGLDVYNVTNNNTTLFYNATFIANVNGWTTPLAYMNPRVFRVNAEFAW